MFHYKSLELCYYIYEKRQRYQSMNNKELVLFHQNKYPHMLLEDHVKRIHQMIFGPAHAHNQPSLAKIQDYITSEINEMNVNDCDDDIIDIGNGFVRIELGMIIREQTPIDLCSHAFFSSMNSIYIDKDPILSMKSAIDELEHMIENNQLPYDIHGSKSWLIHYRSMGYPVIHHSAIYRKLYRPHYRVIHSTYIPNLKK